MSKKKKTLYAIVDIETTGGRAERDRITEIGIVLFDGEKVVKTFESLVNPQTYIPYGITELTGITQEIVADAPKFYEVAREVVEMTEGAIFVAHNVRFDYGFLRAAFKRLGYNYNRKKLCTVRLTRQVFPGLKSYSLSNLIQHFEIEVEDRHRALADALATTELLQFILHQDQDQAKTTEMVNMGVRETLLPNGWTMDRIHALPESCGVYYFHDADGAIIYVGKSTNIRKRIASHFTKDTNKARRLQTDAQDVTYEITGSELLALLRESEEIKKWQPKINRAQRQRSFPYVIKRTLSPEGFISFEIAKVSVKKRKEMQVLATYPSLGAAKSRLQAIAEKFELCQKLVGLEKSTGPCFKYHTRKCLGACNGEELPVDYNERAEFGAAYLLRTFHDDFFIIDEGREDAERTVILIEDGACKGFAFATMEALDDLEGLKEVIKPFNANPEMVGLTLQHLAKNHRLSILPIPKMDELKPMSF